MRANFDEDSRPSSLTKRTLSANSCADGTAPNFKTVKNKDSDENKFGTGIETDERRIENRMKQVLFGKNTIGYDNYISAVPKSIRNRFNPQHPTTPNVHEECSKRQFDGRVRAWRRMLHLWDNVDSLPSPTSSNGPNTKTIPKPLTHSSAEDACSSGVAAIPRKKYSKDAAADAKSSRKPPVHSQVYNRLAQEIQAEKTKEVDDEATQQVPAKRRKVAELAEEDSRLEVENNDEFDRRLIEESQRLLGDETGAAAAVEMMGDEDDDVL